MKCAVKYFDVSTGEADTYEFKDVESISDVSGGTLDGIMTIIHKDQFFQIRAEKLISVIID